MGQTVPVDKDLAVWKDDGGVASPPPARITVLRGRSVGKTECVMNLIGFEPPGLPLLDRLFPWEELYPFWPVSLLDDTVARFLNPLAVEPWPELPPDEFRALTGAGGDRD